MIMASVPRLHFRTIKLCEHMSFNLRNFNFFRRSDSGKAIMLFGSSRFFTWLIAIPYVVSSELIFLRCMRYYALLHGEIAGILVLREEPDTIFVSNLAVAPDYRRHGIATDMIGYCTTIAKKMHKNWLELSVLKGNVPARRLYSKTDFVQKKDRRWSINLQRKIN